MFFAQMTLTGAALIIAAALIRLAAGRVMPRRVFVLLWAIVLLRLLVPFRSVIALPSLPERQTVVYAEHTGKTQTAPAVEYTEQAKPAGQQYAADTDPEPAPEAFVTTQEPAAREVIRSSTVSVRTILKYVWLAGAAAAAALAAVLYAVGYRRFSRAVPAEDGAAQSWLAAHPLRRKLSLRRLDDLISPMTYGIFRPVILIPASLDLEDDAAVLALEHEFIHARRFDPAFKLILTAALALHWFNPAVWLMYVLACRDVELACDEAVLRGIGEEGRAGYARALLSMEERRGLLPALRVSFGSNRTEERIKAIMKFRKRSIAALVLAAVLTLGFAACAVSGPALPEGVESAVYDAVMNYNKFAHAGGNYPCTDIRVLGYDTSGDRTTVYAMVLYESYTLRGGVLTRAAAAHGACAITLEKEADGGYCAVDYRVPGSGEQYARDVKEIFPLRVRAAALNKEKYIYEQEAACRRQAELRYDPEHTCSYISCKVIEENGELRHYMSGKFSYISEHWEKELYAEKAGGTGPAVEVYSRSQSAYDNSTPLIADVVPELDIEWPDLMQPAGIVITTREGKAAQDKDRNDSRATNGLPLEGDVCPYTGLTVAEHEVGKPYFPVLGFDNLGDVRISLCPDIEKARVEIQATYCEKGESDYDYFNIVSKEMFGEHNGRSISYNGFVRGSIIQEARIDGDRAVLLRASCQDRSVNELFDFMDENDLWGVWDMLFEAWLGGTAEN